MISLCLQGKVCDAHSVYIILSIAVEVHPVIDVRAIHPSTGYYYIG